MMMGSLGDIGGTVLTTMGSGTSPVAFLAQLVIASSVICISQVLLSYLSFQSPCSDDPCFPSSRALTQRLYLVVITWS
jgi:hypothetical protein